MEKNILVDLNNFLIGEVFHRSVRFHYWCYSTAGASGAINAPADRWFFYTTRKVDGRFLVACVSIKKDGNFELKKFAKCCVRWKARDKAYSWYCEIAGRPFVSSHIKKKRDLKPDWFQKVLYCIDNTDVEKFFDLNQEYIGRAHRGKTYLVENRFGKNMILPRDKFSEKSD